MTRPVLYEKNRYNIYSSEYQEDDNILDFINDQEEPEQSFVFNDEESKLQKYIIDFDENPLGECCCKCHEKKNRSLQPQSAKNIEKKDLEV